jgi:hypothetical protein
MFDSISNCQLVPAMHTTACSFIVPAAAVRTLRTFVPECRDEHPSQRAEPEAEHGTAVRLETQLFPLLSLHVSLRLQQIQTAPVMDEPDDPDNKQQSDEEQDCRPHTDELLIVGEGWFPG